MSAKKSEGNVTGSDMAALAELEQRVAACEAGLISSGHLVRMADGRCKLPGQPDPVASSAESDADTKD